MFNKHLEATEEKRARSTPVVSLEYTLHKTQSKQQWELIMRRVKEQREQPAEGKPSSSK